MEEDIDILEDFLEYNGFLENSVTKEDIRELQVYMSKNEYKAIQNLISRYKKLEEENKKLKELIGLVRKLSNGVVTYTDYSSDILGPRKNYSKQELYRDYKTIQELLKSDYIFLTTENFLQELLEN